MTLKASCIGIGAYALLRLVRGQPLIERPIHSNKPSHTFNVNDHESDRPKLELTCCPVRPLQQPPRRSTATDSDDSSEFDGGAAAGLSTAACCQKEGLSYVVKKVRNVFVIEKKTRHILLSAR